MLKRLVRDLDIEKALQIEIKLRYNTKLFCMCNGVLYQMRKEIKTRENSPLHMIWSGIIYHLEVYMTPLAGMPSSLVGYIWLVLVRSSIKKTTTILMLQII